jgi:hypothetical protein
MNKINKYLLAQCRLLSYHVVFEKLFYHLIPYSNWWVLFLESCDISILKRSKGNKRVKKAYRERVVYQKSESYGDL